MFGLSCMFFRICHLCYNCNFINTDVHELESTFICAGAHLAVCEYLWFFIEKSRLLPLITYLDPIRSCLEFFKIYNAFLTVGISDIATLPNYLSQIAKGASYFFGVINMYSNQLGSRISSENGLYKAVILRCRDLALPIDLQFACTSLEVVSTEEVFVI